VDLRPLGLGELVDRSAAVWRTHWKPLFRLYLGFQLLQYVVFRAFELVARTWFPILRGGRAANEAMRANPEQLLQQGLIAAPIILVLALLLTVITHSLSVAGAAYAVPILYGRTATVAGAVGRLFQRFGATLGLVGLSLGWLVGWGLVALLPTVVAVVLAVVIDNDALKVALAVLGSLWAMGALLAVLLGYVVRFAIAGPVIAMDEVGAGGAYRRAGALSSGRIGEGLLGLVKLRLALVITVVGVILMVVSIVGSLPALIIEGYYGRPFDPANADPDAVPQLLLVPAQLLSLVLGSIVAPLYAVAMGWFYVDMRMRREGLDLELKLGAKL
jgi:hypothetical protein